MNSPLPSQTQATCRQHIVDWIFLSLAMGAFAIISWRKWGDILYDLGHQFYVPWVLSEGALLYDDVSYLYGPLSSYLHAFIFSVFGTGAIHLAIFNLILAWLTGLMLHHWFMHLFSRTVAVISAFTFGTLFVFGHPTHDGNFNFIWPYVYDLPHGVLLSLVALYQLDRFLQDSRIHRIAGIGFLLGCIYLTKTEVFLAAAGSLIPVMVWWLRRQSASRELWIKKIFFFVICACTPPFLFFMFFSFHVPAQKAFYWLIQPWMHMFNGDVRELRYYQYILGTSDFSANLARIASYTLVLVLTLASLFGINHFLNRKGWNTSFGAGLLILAISGGLWVFSYRIPWLNLIPPLPLLLLLVILYQLKELAKPGLTKQPQARRQSITILVFAVFSFLLVLKVLFRVRVYHYGFALALPGTLLMIGILLHALPEHLKSHWGPMKAFRSGVATGVVAFVLVVNMLSIMNYERKQFPIGQGVDRIIDFSPQMLIVGDQPRMEGMMTEFAIEYINANFPTSAEFVAFPEFDILNYLTRRKSPVPDTKFNPGVALVLGEAPVLARLKANVPTHVVLVGKEFNEFGQPYFGRDFGADIYAWIRGNYRVVKQIGPAPFEGQGFGIQFLTLKSTSLNE
ncbi:ArnT family glycosyltransferase [Nitrospina gracilis]|uniref:ArnT family glycosyltransferase n=1 Tax=Nitrospina gracilis TaxID=35801 RepID=UPI001F28B9B7|nr:glycosyltransferase family 39 protein [Nitrospina gracilis]MCF8721841.1 hypothetical protein [Nitrospina gracilis Nb-211]